MSRIRVLLLEGLLGIAGVLVVTSSAGSADLVEVCGSGYGHGVGLSQYGAYGRALAGQSYKRIVKAYYRGTELETHPSNPFMRVLLGEKGLDEDLTVAVPSGGEARLRNFASGELLPLDPASYRVQYLPGGKLYRVTDLSTGDPVGDYAGPVRFEPVSGFLGYGGRSYRGTLLAEVSGSRLYLINRVRMENYVRGVVPNEMPASWSSAALKSQAIAARSYAYATRKGGPFDFYADARSQTYGGASSETASTNSAVAATARMVAVYDGEPVTASYYSANGGYTESAYYAFGNRLPYLKAFRDVDSGGKPFETRAHSPWTSWSGTLAPDSSPQLGIGSIQGVRVLERSPSGRATKVEVTGTGGKKTVSGESNIRFGLKVTDLTRADGSSYPAGYLPSARVSFGAECG